jgi:hypothetical protein
MGMKAKEYYAESTDAVVRSMHLPEQPTAVAPYQTASRMMVWERS